MVAALPKVATYPSHAVNALCELTMNCLQCSMHAFLGCGDHDQMYVVRHQAVGIDRQFESTAVGMQEIEIDFGIADRVKHSLAVIATLRNVVRHARKDCAGGPGHLGKVNCSIPGSNRTVAA